MMHHIWICYRQYDPGRPFAELPVKLILKKENVRGAIRLGLVVHPVVSGDSDDGALRH